jgi:hypothetical protein
MRAHVFAIAVAALAAAPAVAADSPTAPVTKAGQPANQSPPVLVDAADPGVPQALDRSEQQQPAAQKPARHARVTTCRCGDQTPSN